jgi:hypothetical protein
MTRSLLAVVVAVLVLVGGAPPAGASEDWCEFDPLVLIATPGGRLVPVYVLTGAAGLAHLPLVTAARYDYAAAPTAGGTATLVKLEVLVPPTATGGTFATRATVSTGPAATGTVLASATGTSGQPMKLTFKLAVP